MDRPSRLEPLGDEADGRQCSPSARRNRDDILAALRPHLPARGLVVEVASGTGEHAVHFARALPALTWQPSDRDPAALRSIAAWRAHAALPNVRPPAELDLLAAPPAPAEPVAALVAINVLHITPWPVAVALLDTAARWLPGGAPLAVYGAMFRAGEEPAPSNLAFDARLRELDPAYGVRRLDDLDAAAAARGLRLDAVTPMRNRNTLVVWRRAPVGGGRG